MQHVKLTSSFPAVLKPLIAAVFLFLAVIHTPPSAGAQALEQLYAYDPALSAEIPPPPGVAALYRGQDGFAVYFLAVGQGDAIYLELPGGQNALIDGGPSASASGALAKFLADKKVSKIDHVVLTHPHSDHYNGLSYVFTNFKIGSFYDTRLDNASATGDESVRAKAAASGARLVYPAEGDRLAWGAGPEVKVLHACDQPMQSKKSEVANNCSITLRVAYQDVSVMFTGDIGTDTENELVARYGAGLKSEVLKVGHHGSQYSTSEAFLRAVNPAKAFIEVGSNNYGHPTKTVLDRLTAFGTKIFRTDTDGTVEYPSLACPVLAMAN